MPEELSGDLDGVEVWGASMRGAHLRDVDLTGSRIDHALVDDVVIDGVVDRLVVNGVDVTAYVDERDRWRTERATLRASTPDELRAGWATLDAAWRTLIERVLRMPAGSAEASVDGEWSLVQTLRHLVFALDKWFTVPVLGGSFHPFGLPNTGSREFPFPGLELDRTTELDDVLPVWAERSERLASHLARIDATELARTVDVLENGEHQILDCVRTVLEEAFWHLRYATRDLGVLTPED